MASILESMALLLHKTAKESDGSRVVRSRRGDLPFQITLSCSDGKVAKRAKTTPETRAMPMPEGDDDEEGDEGECEDVVVTGTASSTSVDWYGTEMSERCLHEMANQFIAGVGVFPSHGGGLFGPGLEWDDELGKTTAAEVVRALVAEAADSGEPSFVLQVSMTLDGCNPKVKELCRRLDRGQKIGLSIGGWFREVRYIESEESDGWDDNYERIIVESVELDHLAIVRAPANPDCQDLEMLSKAGRAFRRSLEVRGATPFADLPTAPEDTAWSFSTEDEDAVLGDGGDDWARFKKAHFWFDPDKSEEKGGFKLPFAKMIDGSLKAVLNGVSAAMAALNGARGGVDIPDEDRQAVYDHIRKYYDKFGKEAPELKAKGDEPPAGDVEDSSPAPTSTESAPTVGNPEEVTAPQVLDSTSLNSENRDMALPVMPQENEDMDQELKDLIRNISDRLTTLEGRAAPAAPQAETAEQKLVRLEAENANLNRTIENMAGQPLRAGTRSAFQASGVLDDTDSLIERAKGSGKSKAVVIVAARAKNILNANFRAKGAEGQKTREAAEAAPEFLRSILCAAEADGTLDDFMPGRLQA